MALTGVIIEGDSHSGQLRNQNFKLKDRKIAHQLAKNLWKLEILLLPNYL